MLVLDCSSSLGNDFSTLKSHAKDFISKLQDASNGNSSGGNGGGGSQGGNNDFNGVNRTFTVNGVQFTMVAVEGGTFEMGNGNGGGDVTPVHNVTLSSYYIGQTEVTQALWTAVIGSNPSRWKGDDLPVEYVSWNACQNFITKLNALTGEKFRLPTEAEWEFAAKGGNKSKGYVYSGSNTIGDVAWYDGNSGDKTHPVGTKMPNELGIYDMSGNVFEWCQDWYGSYSNSAQTNPTGPVSGSDRVLRGGGWSDYATYSRAAYRGYYNTPSISFSNFGLRLAL
ncbi:MAG: formylglycine-generating enzyme family protein [Prevotellaceae bacterium]|nr:formylglycine-generating enzyme family protein [Prevotellaceae bacterium]